MAAHSGRRISDSATRMRGRRGFITGYAALNNFKFCPSCGITKECSEFHSCRHRKDGLRFSCKVCTRKENLEWHRKNPDRSKENSRKWSASHKAQHKALIEKWGKSNKDKLLGYYRKHHIKHAEKRREYGRQYLKKNRAWSLEKNRARYASQRGALPKWANRFFMQEIYDLAYIRSKATGIKWHVDHIVPLQSKKVCGLHVEHNLQVITALENHQKYNRYWPDMP